MKVIHRMFLSFINEKSWLDKMNSEGFELTRAALFTFEFEKTDTKVQYEYIPLRHGKKTYLALDYKKKDKNIKAVYANAQMALFKKPVEKGTPGLMSGNEKKLAFARYKSSLSTSAVMFFAIASIIILLAGRVGFPLLYIPAGLFILVSAGDFYKSVKTEKYIKTLK